MIALYCPDGLNRGRIGVWAGVGSGAAKVDDLVVRSLAGSHVVDGRFVDDSGNVKVASGKLTFYSPDPNVPDGTTRRSVLPPVRMSKGITQADLTYITNIDTGLIVNYQDPENFGVALLDASGANVTARYVEYVDGKLQAVRASGSAFSTLSSGSTYTVQAVIGNDPNDPNLAQLKLYVDGTLRLTTTTIDDTWSGGHVGLFRVSSSFTSDLSWDNFLCGLDNDGDGTLGNINSFDIGDWIYAAYNFDDGANTWQTLTLTHDAAGNLTNDGVRKYRYDAWNRLVGVFPIYSTLTDPNQAIALYRYDGLNRRIRKEVRNQGIGIVDGSDDNGFTGILAGNRIEEYYWGSVEAAAGDWQLLETRNGLGQTLQQFVYGTQYIDEPVALDRNTDVASDNDCVDSSGSVRYSYHQEANYRVTALVDEGGYVLERYEYSAYGEPIIIAGADRGPELGYVRLASAIGNPLMHQGLFRDSEAGQYQNRQRSLLPDLGRFGQRDLLGYIDGNNLYEALLSNPWNIFDEYGLDGRGSGGLSGGAAVAKLMKKYADALKKVRNATCNNIEPLISQLLALAEELDTIIAAASGDGGANTFIQEARKAANALRLACQATQPQPKCSAAPPPPPPKGTPGGGGGRPRDKKTPPKKPKWKCTIKARDTSGAGCQALGCRGSIFPGSGPNKETAEEQARQACYAAGCHNPDAGCECGHVTCHSKGR